MKMKLFGRIERLTTAREFREELFPVGELGGVSAETNWLTYRFGVHCCRDGNSLRNVVLEASRRRSVKRFRVRTVVCESGRARV